MQLSPLQLTRGYNLLVLLLSLGSFGGYGQSSRYDIRQHFDGLYAGYGDTTPGAAVLVVEGDSILFAEGYGTANLEYGIPVDTGTVFQVASISKQFTAFAVYLLAADGLIGLEDAAGQYLPELTQFAPAIRVDHLLSHTSGLKDHLALLTFAGWRMDEYVDNDQILRLVARQRELNFAPGSAFRYSNTNYVLLAELVERVSGMSLDAFLRERVFEPLGMDHTQFYDDHERLIPHRAYGYDFAAGRFKKEALNNSYVGSTGLFTTAADLAKWSANFYDPVVGDPALIATFNAATTLDNGSPAYADEQLGIRHAKGQFLREYRGLTSFIHTGSDGGFRAFLGRWPARRLTVILLSNDARFAPYPNGFGFAERYLEPVLGPYATFTPPVASPSGEKVAKPKAPLTPEAITGTYHSDELDSTFDLRFVDGKPLLSHFRLGDIPLRTDGKGGFSGVNWYSFTVDFPRGADGRVTGMEIVDFRGERLRFERMEEATATER
ncbi:CubicO group peptidase (beta-lactamase class C family) [Neolewinella xylanilytica]|uniref:CubicO group peptidase (Beta-lactamase class C family) n=1 Tax=Neolewinella xylanilytica TaxID=1514080 RepID=A0A2S6I8E7_9BACT|nr:serine hydrolase domain-containing protein [Neolewinella xylanilytica]PPK87763.1 CubicO group peptidase (beta-lactamase class C family) [Neolewinella xylanilytica]